MKVYNSSAKKRIAMDAEVCSGLFSKAKGLMFSKRSRTLIFDFRKEKIVPLHMCFVFFPIDVLFLGKEKRVVEIKENFLPWTFYTPKNKAQYIIELSKGTVKKTGTKIGDVLRF